MYQHFWVPVWLFAALPLMAEPASTGASDALFVSHDPLELRIEGPIKRLKSERPENEDLAAIASWVASDGSAVSVDVGLRTRGNYRRDKRNCSFPPVRLNFKTSQLKDTLFANQDKLKLVTHCKDNSSRYEQALVREFLAYRLLNELTDISYRARLVRITYADSEKDKDAESLAVIVEHKDRFSKRVGLPIVEIPGTSPDKLNREYANLISIFQYFLGNTDFSPIAGAEGHDCCHNINLYGGESTGLFTVPYDFDITGMVNAPHASPNPRFNLRSVRQRLYRGRCINNAHIDASIQQFAAAKESLYGVIRQQTELKPSAQKRMLSFVDSFYKTIENPKAVEKQIRSRCVGPR